MRELSVPFTSRNQLVLGSTVSSLTTNPVGPFLVPGGDPNDHEMVVE